MTTKTVEVPSREELLARGRELIEKFCNTNGVPCPDVTEMPSRSWPFSVCAFYRPEGWKSASEFSNGFCEGINICLPKCAKPCGESMSRQWSWPGSVIDRTPYGVLAHELGHHCDWLSGEEKHSYFSDYGMKLVKDAGEKPITGYCDNPAEHFAEFARLYITNHSLLKLLRPRAWHLLAKRWKPVSAVRWREALLPGLPERVLKSLLNKGAR